MDKIILITEDQLKKIIDERLSLFFPPKKIDTLMSKNQVAIRLGRSHSTIKKMCESGFLETTPDGMILESSVEIYLNKK